MQQITLQFKVQKIQFSNEESGYTIIKASPKPNQDIDYPSSQLIVTGYYPTANIGDDYEAIGRFVSHDIYGWSFATQQATRILPQTHKAMIAFISKLAKGIGIKTAKEIVAKHGDNTFEALERGNTEDFEGILSEKMAKRLTDAYNRERYYQQIFIYTQNAGVQTHIAAKLYKEFNRLAIRTIQANPYALVEFDWFGFSTADKFGAVQGIKADDPRRIEGAVMHYLYDITRTTGHFYQSKQCLEENINSWLDTNTVIKNNNMTTEQIDAVLTRLIQQDRICIVDVDKIYIKSVLKLEDKIVKAIKDKLNQPVRILQAPIDTNLADKQKEAVQKALQNGISILTGGPGTGKTHTTSAIIKAIKHADSTLDIKLAAPTGKAARRLADMTDMDAMTIHRLLGLKKDDSNDDVIMCYADVLIIDEASMIDAGLWATLLANVSPQTRLVIVGDVDQLPAIGVGSVLHDLIASGIVPVTRLTDVFRQAQGSQIIQNAYAVINQKPEDITIDHSKGDFYHIERDVPMAIHWDVVESVKRMATKYGLANVQVLTPQKTGVIGAADLNKSIQAVINPPSSDKAELKYDAVTFRVGDRVMQTENNKDIDVQNGEIGTIIDIDDEAGEIVVEYGVDEVIYSPSIIHELTLAYAMSVHKAQGSEFACVIMPIHNTQSEFLLNRNLLYTAITRAKSVMITTGQRAVIDRVITDIEYSPIRNSRIIAKLRAN